MQEKTRWHCFTAKISGETPSPIMPDEFESIIESIIKKLPRDPEDVDLF